MPVLARLALPQVGSLAYYFPQGHSEQGIVMLEIENSSASIVAKFKAGVKRGCLINIGRRKIQFNFSDALDSGSENFYFASSSNCKPFFDNIERHVAQTKANGTTKANVPGA
ncbi:hypothetical protein E2542_SST04000 [Spatholobus suberectus]|nr:hypothetical protein E2542_SST04000 [Spatholobus suberectus]